MRKTNDQSLPDLLKEFAEQSKYKNKLTSKKFENIWFELFSSLAGSHTEKIYFHNGVLTVHLNSASLRKELSLNKKLIIQQINTKLSDETLTDVLFK
ncbi:MAG: DciA family protein [Saprospiraceae bacterium]